MLPLLLRSFPRLGRTWKPMNFSNPNFTRIQVNQKIEEETVPNYVAARYYPARVGQIFKDRYQIVGKLGFGTSSTVWLARDMIYRRYVTIKIFIKSASLGQQLDDEFQMYSRIESGSKYPPSSLLARGRLSHKFFSDEGTFHAKDLLTDQIPLEKRETTIEDAEDKACFLRLMRKMLQWEPEQRSSAKELQEDEWIRKKLE